MPLPQVSRRPAEGEAVPFASAEAAWFWTMNALVARREGAGLVCGDNVPRPCEPDDVVRWLDRLYQHQRIELRHASALRRWGEVGRAPHPNANPLDHALWTEALLRLSGPLFAAGVLEAPK